MTHDQKSRVLSIGPLISDQREELRQIEHERQKVEDKIAALEAERWQLVLTP